MEDPGRMVSLDPGVTTPRSRRNSSWEIPDTTEGAVIAETQETPA